MKIRPLVRYAGINGHDTIRFQFLNHSKFKTIIILDYVEH
jgi:hypothetical protein